MITRFGRILILMLIIFLSISCNYAQEKRGLIIAISKYKDNNWREIHSCNDVPLIKNILLSQGFKENNIKVLEDSLATKKGIINSLENLLIESGEGDVVVIHFSGHGQRIYDDNGDESDFADEALIPYDAYQQWSDFYKGENHLRDDEIGEYLIKLRKKIGPKGNIIFFVDACYSGTIARNSEFYRGIDDIFSPPDYKEKISNLMTSPDKSTGIFKSSEANIEVDNNSLAGIVIFTSSRNNERSKEVTDGKNFYGSLSYALSFAFSRINGNETYREIYDRVYSYMKFKARLSQIPLIEGNIDNIVFSDKLLPTEPYFKITDKNIYGEYIVNGGRMTGLSDSTLVGIFNEDVKNPELSIPITTGLIYDADNFQSLIRIADVNKLFESDLGKYHLFILKEGIIAKKLFVAFENIDESLKNSIVNRLSTLKYFEENNQNPDYILSNINPNRIEITDSIFLYRSGNQLKFISSFLASSFDSPEEIKTKLKNLYKKDLLIGFDMSNEFYNVEVKIKNISKGTESNQAVQESNFLDTIVINIKNTGKRPGYITLLNVQPDDSIKQIIPKPNENLSQYYIEPGGVIEKKFKNTKLGEDIYKVFITKDYIDFSYILYSDINKRNGNLSEIEILFSEVNEGVRPRGNLSIAGATKQILINVIQGK